MSFQGTDRYKVERLLGAGGFGEVYEAVDRQRGDRVAIKTLKSLEPDALYRFKKEFRSLADLAHPNLITLHELHADGESWFFTMELVDGVDLLTFVLGGGLSEALAPTIAKKAVLDPRTLRRVLRQLAEGVNHLHGAGKLHRDLKPANVLVTAEGRVVILDFGLVTEMAGERTTDANVIQGTVAYMSPEQARGDGVQQPADWYAVGVMLYQALTGTLPYRGSPMAVLMAKQNVDPSPPWEIEPEVPRELADLCMQLLARDAEDRPGGEEVLLRLGPVSQEVPRPSAVAPGEDPALRPTEDLRPEELEALRQGQPMVLAPAKTAVEQELFIGREQELAALREAFDEARQGKLVNVLVRGEPGIGKTALLHQFGKEVTSTGTMVLRGRCYQQESVPFKAFDGLIDSLTHALRHLPPVDVAGLVPRHAPYLLRLFPVLARVQALAQAPGAADDVADPIERQKRAFAALRELLQRLLDRGPVLLLLDDMQWADADSLALLDSVVSTAEAPPLLLVMSARNPGLPGRVRFSDLHSLELGPLSSAEGAEFAGKLLSSSDERATQIAAEAAGHPLFIQELSLRSPKRTDQSTSLEQAIWQRVQELNKGARQLLTFICVAGAPLPEPVFQAASAGEQGTFSARVAELLSGKLVRRLEGAELEPFHDRVRESVTEYLSPEVKLTAHRNLAEALSKGGAEERPELLLEHLRACGEQARAYDLAQAAARRAEEVLAFDRAARLWGEALDLIDPDDVDTRRTLQMALGYALGSAGRGVAAAEALTTAAEGADEDTV